MLMSAAFLEVVVSSHDEGEGRVEIYKMNDGMIYSIWAERKNGSYHDRTERRRDHNLHHSFQIFCGTSDLCILYDFDTLWEARESILVL